ncbi:hypothetical protein HZB78_02955 [Candidatus Collierbacteria bacterium]|nr:hypothetical protein [Candidatus Collierbacteria bacterium]
MSHLDNLAIKILSRVRKFWEFFILIVIISGTYITVWAVIRPGNVFDPRRYAADNMCNVDGRTCDKPEDWERGWIEARQAENINKAPVQNEYTSANPDNDPKQGVTQEAQIIRQAGESNEVNRSSIAAEEAAKKNDPVNKPVVTDPTLPPLLPTAAAAAAPTTSAQPTIQPAGGLSPTTQPTAPPATAIPTAITTTPVPERYGITDNICHLPGANCKDEDWQKGNAAARGDTKALAELQKKNPGAFSTVAVDGGIVKTITPAAAAPAAAQPTIPATAATDAQTRRAEFTKQCAKDLHLCPMIDPNTYQVVGWVPAEEAAFGTFEDAKLARQKLSIGDLRKYNVPELLSGDKLRSATAEEMQKELTKAFSGEEGAKLIEQLKNTPSGSLVKLNSQGAAVKNKDGDIVLNSGETLNKQTQVSLEKKYLEDRLADAKTQNDTANALLASLANKLEECLKEGKTADGACGITKLSPDEKQKFDSLTDDRKKEISSGQSFQKLQQGVTKSYAKEKLVIEALAKSGTAAVTAQCVAERGEQSCNTTAQLDYYVQSLAQGFDSATGNKIKTDYANKKKEENDKFIAKLHNDQIAKAQKDIEKDISQSASVLISMVVKPEDRDLAIQQLVKGNIDFSRYPNLSESEKQSFREDYLKQRYFSIYTNLRSDEIAKYQNEIDALKQQLPKPGGGGGLKSIAKSQIPSVETETSPTAPQLTGIQQAQLTAAQTGLGIVNWWNNTGLAQGINKRATDLGVINAQSPQESLGRFLNTATVGAFGQYAAAYADINAQNLDASYLNRAFNPKGLDASQALLAQTVTATLPDGGQFSGQFVNTLLDAPLIGARRYIDAGVVGAAALQNNNTGQLLQANAYGAYHIFGIDNTVNSSNRLFYQTGMSPAEAEAYKNNPWLRAEDAVTVGMAAVSVGDVAASIKLSGLEKTLVQGPLSQRGAEQFFKNLADNLDEAKRLLKTDTRNWTSDYPMADISGMNRLNNPANYPEQYTKDFLLNASAGGGAETNNPVVIKYIQDLKEQIKDAAAAQDAKQLNELTKQVDVLEKYEQLKRILGKMDKDRRQRFIEQLSDQVAQDISGKDPTGKVVGLPKAKIYSGFGPLFATNPEKGFNIIEHDPDTAEFIADVGSRAVNKLYANNPNIPDPAFDELRNGVISQLMTPGYINGDGGINPNVLLSAVSKEVNSRFKKGWQHTGTSLAKSVAAPFLNDKPTAAALVCQGTANCYQTAQVTADLINSFNQADPTKLYFFMGSQPVFLGPAKAKVVMNIGEIPHASTLASSDAVWVSRETKIVNSINDIPINIANDQISKQGENIYTFRMPPKGNFVKNNDPPMLIPYLGSDEPIDLWIEYTKKHMYIYKHIGEPEYGNYVPSTLQFNR